MLVDVETDKFCNPTQRKQKIGGFNHQLPYGWQKFWYFPLHKNLSWNKFISWLLVTDTYCYEAYKMAFTNMVSSRLLIYGTWIWSLELGLGNPHCNESWTWSHTPHARYKRTNLDLGDIRILTKTAPAGLQAALISEVWLTTANRAELLETKWKTPS